MASPTVYGTFGDASVIGWAGNSQAVVACLGGSFWVDADGPGSGPPTIARTYGYGVYNDTPTTWTNADGYLPALVTAFQRDGATISITNFGDEVTIGGNDFVIIYSRVTVTNRTAAAISINPEPSAGLIPLNSAPDTVPPHSTVNHDYAVESDSFGGTYPPPSASAIVAAGSLDQHFAHMSAYWNDQLAGITQILALPDPSLIDAYKTGFIYTQIIRSGDELKTGANGYDTEFSHDVIGILANLFTQGYTDDAHGLLLSARDVVGDGQFADAVWTYPWLWAVYLLKTGDLSFVEANFDTEGPAGASGPSIEDTAHMIAADRTGPGGIMEETTDIDKMGYWTVDNYEALTGLAAYQWLAEKVGNLTEAQWAASEYRGLLAATSDALNKTIEINHLQYLPCSMLMPNTNTGDPCANPEDANWAAPFLFGRWAWDGYLFGAALRGPGLTLIDATYRYGFARLAGLLPPNTFGGYPGYSTAYNAGYGEWGLASNDYRDQGILSYEFMIANGQDGPYSWWESQLSPNLGSPWIGIHPAGGDGSSPHAWGMANANMVLLDSLVAQRADGSLIVGRGVPDAWVLSGGVISLANFPTTDGQHAGLTIRTSHSGRLVELTLTGQPLAGPVLFQLPAFVDNILRASAGVVDEGTGTVTLAATVRTVSVELKHAEPAS